MAVYPLFYSNILEQLLETLYREAFCEANILNPNHAVHHSMPIVFALGSQSRGDLFDPSWEWIPLVLLMAVH